MALTAKQRKILKDGLADGRVADEIADAIDNGVFPEGAAVANISPTSDMTALVPAASAISASAGTYAIAAEPTGAEVDTAIDELKDKVDTSLDLKADNADVETLRVESEARLDAVEAKIDALLVQLRAVNVIAT